MKITEVLNQGLKRHYSVVVPKQDIDSKVHHHVTRIGKTVKMDGFRPGKVPQHVLMQRYGKDAWMDAAQEAVREAIAAVVKENNLTPIMDPGVEAVSFQEGADIEVLVKVEETPQFDLKPYGDLQLEKFVVEASEDDLAEAMKMLAEGTQIPTALKKARAAKKGDIAVIAFEGRLEKSGDLIEGGSHDRFPLELGTGSFIPGFEEQIEGMKAGDEKEISVTFPKDYHEKKLAGQPTIFKINLHELQEKVEASIDDALATHLGFENLDALKEHMKQEIERNAQAASRTYMKRKLLDYFADQYDFEVPETMVDTEFDLIWRQLQQALSQSQDRAEVLGDDADKDEETLKKDYRAIAERRVRLGLLLAEIGKKNSIDVSQEELSAAVLAEARRYPHQAREIFDYYTKNKQALMQLRAPLFEEKIVDFLFQGIKLLETKISSKELGEKIEAL